MIKKLLISSLIFLASAHVFAGTTTVKASEMGTNEMHQWDITTQDDGYYQILGLYDNKKLVVRTAYLHKDKPADAITIECNSGDGKFEPREVKPGNTITCYPHYKDVIYMYIHPNTLRNGAEGQFWHEPYSPSKTN